MVTATNLNANQDEPDLWKADSKSFDVGGKMRQTNARRVSCLNKFVSGNHLGQNDPHPPAADDRVPCSRFIWAGIMMLPNEASRIGVDGP